MTNPNEPLNPYEKIAELHNKGLDYLIKKLSKKTAKGLSREQILETVCEYFKEISGQTSIVDEAINYATLTQLLSKGGDNDDALKQLDLTEKAQKKINTLLSINSEEGEDILKKIGELETEVLNSEFNERDKSYTLLLLSIAKASVKYWENEKKKVNSLWNKVVGKIKKIPWKADVKGAARALVNPTVDIIFDGTPIKPVIVVGKIIGNAIVASALEYSSEAKKINDQNLDEENAKLVAEKQRILKEKSRNLKFPKGI